MNIRRVNSHCQVTEIRKYAPTPVAIGFPLSVSEVGQYNGQESCSRSQWTGEGSKFLVLYDEVGALKWTVRVLEFDCEY